MKFSTSGPIIEKKTFRVGCDDETSEAPGFPRLATLIYPSFFVIPARTPSGTSGYGAGAMLEGTMFGEEVERGELISSRAARSVVTVARLYADTKNKF